MRGPGFSAIGWVVMLEPTYPLDRFPVALAASLLACLATTAGICVIRRFSGWGERHSTGFMAFAAGVLISASFLHVIPKAFSMTSQAPGWMLAGFFGLHVVNRFLSAFVCGHDPCRGDVVALGIVPMLGIGFHSLVDGFIYSVTFAAGLLTGSLVSIGMVLHEFPEGIITYLLLVRGGIGEGRSAMLAFLAAAATTPLGMIISWPLMGVIGPAALGALLALSGGALVYVGASHLLPRVEREARRFTLAALAGGVLVAVMIVLFES